jgi:glycine/D-amino acid oxidase-like deaminating enzyme
VPLLKRSRELWLELNKRTGKDIFQATGGLYISPPENPRREEEIAKIHNLTIEMLSGTQVKERFPVIEVPDSWKACYEADAGFIVPEWSIPAYANIAREHGAELHENVQVVDWFVEKDRVVVRTSTGERFVGDKLVVCVGAWAQDIAKVEGLKITSSR